MKGVLMVATATKPARTKLSLSWYSDLKAESDLSSLAVSFDIETIPFIEIDLKESQVNGARLNGALLEHKIEDYMQGMRNGDTFPRPVVHKTPTGFVILSGNQRCESVRRLIVNGELPKNTSIDCYVVDTTDKLLLEIIARCANVAHGEGTPKEERIQQGVYFVRALGMLVRDAAKLCMVSETGISHHIRAEEQRKELAAAGINATRVPVSTL
jgi:hypothetical protein